jgi:hypothetical protein
MTDGFILTPFEQAAANAKMHPARMNLCDKVNDLIEHLIEIQKLKELPGDCEMFDASILEMATAEEARIMNQLVILADMWEKTEGVSA